jgi:mannose-1-phosphate guanylyltransferase
MAKPSKSNHYIAILCGGTGPRLWPLSRASSPKQFLKILSPDHSFLQQAIQRALWLVPPQNIYIVTNQRYQKEIQREVAKTIPPKNILFEPQKKNTALAMIWSTATIAQKNPQAVVSHFASDHYIGHRKNFISDLKKSVSLAQKQNCLITIGIKPTWPNPAYGYIKVGQKDQKTGSFPSLTFTEKPSVFTAKKYLKTKKYLWNANFYTWTPQTLKDELLLHHPAYFKLYLKLEKDPQDPKNIKSVYSTPLALPIDRALSEKTKNLRVIPATFAWSDVGEWGSIHEVLSQGKPDPINLNSTQSINLDSKNLIIKSDPKKIVGTVAAQDLAIIDTPNALLVCSLKDSFKVRELVGQIVENKKTIAYFLKTKDEG